MSETPLHTCPWGRRRPERCIIPLAALVLWGAPARAQEAPERLGLQATIVEAHAAAPSLLGELARRRSAGADAAAATGALLPRVQLSGSWTLLDEDRLGAIGGIPLFDREAVVTLKARQVLFDWRAFAGRLAAGRAEEAAESAVATADAEAALAATVAWVRLAQAEEIERSTAKALERARAFEETAVAFSAAGRGSPIDPLRARSARLEAERAAIAAKEALPAAGARLGQALGRGDAVRLRSDGRWPEGASELPTDADALARARTSSPDLARLDALVSAARAAAASVRATWLPEIAATGTLGWRERSTPSWGTAGRTDTSHPEWTAGVTLDWTIFEGGAGVAAMTRADARVAELEAVRAALGLQLGGDVRDALGAWRAAAAGLEAARQSQIAAAEAREAANALFRSGRATSLELLGAEADLQRAEAAVVGAQGDLVLARARAVRLGAAEPPGGVVRPR